MIARFFHSWEHRLASVSKDRVVRPFEWGTDWVGADSIGSTEAEVAAWVDAIMQDTDEFFACPPTTDYQFLDASDELRAGGEAGTLRFPSALVTPHEENNLVAARWFPAQKESPPGRRRVAAARSSSSRSGTRTPRGMSAWRNCLRGSTSRRSA